MKVKCSIIFFCCCGFCNAQQIVSSGGYISKSDISVDWILDGNLSDITNYDELSLAGLRAEQMKETEIVLTVYPIPAHDFINIVIAPIDSGRLILKLFDNSGTVFQNRIVAVEPVMNFYIGDISPGVYYLKIFFQNSDQIFRSVKIIKTQTSPL